MNSGIYIIVAPSGSEYVGSTRSFSMRKRAHWCMLQNNCHCNLGLRRASLKYGVENMRFEVLLVCSPHDLLFFEQRAIDVRNPRYNICRTAGSCAGKPHSAESRAKNALAHLGKRASDETRAKMSLRRMNNKFMIGRKLSPEWRSSISAGLKGVTHRDSFINRITPELTNQICYDYLNGAGLLDLAKKYRADHRPIRALLLENNIAIRDSHLSAKRQQARAS